MFNSFVQKMMRLSKQLLVAHLQHQSSGLFTMNEELCIFFHMFDVFLLNNQCMYIAYRTTGYSWCEISARELLHRQHGDNFGNTQSTAFRNLCLLTSAPALDGGTCSDLQMVPGTVRQLLAAVNTLMGAPKGTQ